MEKNGNGSGEPLVTIRASLNKIASDLEDLELVIFLARKKRRRMLDARQETLDNQAQQKDFQQRTPLQARAALELVAILTRAAMPPEEPDEQPERAGVPSDAPTLPSPSSGGFRLSERDRIIQELNHQGLSNRAISRTLFETYGIQLAETSVRRHLVEMYQDPDNNIRLNFEATYRKPQGAETMVQHCRAIAENDSCVHKTHGLQAICSYRCFTTFRIWDLSSQKKRPLIAGP